MMHGMHRGLGRFPVAVGGVLWLLFTLSAAQAAAPWPEEGYLVPQLHYLPADAGELSLEQVRALPLAGWSTGRRGAAGSSWLAFEITPAPGRAWLIELPQPRLPEAQVFVYQGEERLAAHAIGRNLPFTQRPYAHRNFLLPMPAHAEGVLRVYLQVPPPTAARLPLRVWSESAWAAAEQRSLLGQGLFFGVIGVMLLFNLALGIWLRDRARLYYVGLLAALGLLVASLNGLAFQLLWPQAVLWNAYAPGVWAAASAFFVAAFSTAFLDLSRLRPGHALMLRIVACAAVAGIALGAVLGPVAMVLQGSGLALGTALLVVLAALTLPASAAWGARHLALIGALMAGLGLLVALSGLGLLPRNLLTVYGLQGGAALAAVLLALMLARRHYLAREERLKAQAQELEQRHSQRPGAAGAEVGAATVEEHLERRVQERTRELEAALARLSQTNQALADMSFIDGLTGIGNRRCFDQRYRSEWQRAYRERRELALILIDIDCFKGLNDSHGHLAGDACLRALAAVLADAASRSSDCVARFGGEEFAVIMPHTAVSGALHLAEQIRRQVAALRVPYEGVELSFTVSAGVAALVPADRHHQAILLSFADDALYRAKRGGRNRVLAFTPSAPAARAQERQVAGDVHSSLLPKV